MNKFYTPEHSQHCRHSAFNVIQIIFKSYRRRQLAEWENLLLKVELNLRLELFWEDWSVLVVIKQATSIKHGGQ